MIKPVEELVGRLEYQFKDASLLKAALTHRSAGNANNERLEYLGDAVLGFVIAEALYCRFPAADEGTLSRLRSNLVKQEPLADIARQLDLGSYLTLGSGELRSGGYRRDSILADAMEAVLGAILIDSDFDNCSACIHQLFAVRLDKIDFSEPLKDPKTRLQEYLQGRRQALPVYEIGSVQGKAHNQKFTIHCQVEALRTQSIGTGSSRRKAEQQAAAEMLKLLEENS